MRREHLLGRIGPAAGMLFVFLLTGCAQGPATEGKFRSGDQVTISSNEVLSGDLYVTGGTVIVDGATGGDLTVCGGTVTVNGSVGGNLLACGGQITLNGDVRGDVTAGGGQITISGPVGGDVRIGGGVVLLSSQVGEDVVVGAGNVVAQRTARIGGDLVFGAGSADVAGSVAGDIIGQADTYTRSGTVGGKEAVRITAETGDRRPAPTTSPELAWLLGRLRTLAVLLVVGVLLVWLRPGWLDGLAERIVRRPLPSLGWGLLTWVGVPFGVVVLTVAWIVLAVLFGIVTLNGLVAAVVTTGLLADAAIILALVLSAVFLAWVVVGLAVGQFSLTRLAAGTVVNRFIALAVGIVLLVVLGSVPYLSVIVTILVGLCGVGVLGWAAYDMLQRRGRATTPRGHEGAPVENPGQ